MWDYFLDSEKDCQSFGLFLLLLNFFQGECYFYPSPSSCRIGLILFWRSYIFEKSVKSSGSAINQWFHRKQAVFSKNSYVKMSRDTLNACEVLICPSWIVPKICWRWRNICLFPLHTPYTPKYPQNYMGLILAAKLVNAPQIILLNLAWKLLII